MDGLIETVRDSLARASMPAAKPWSVAIFSARETPDMLNAAVRAALRASAATDIEVLVNGNKPLADATAQAAPRFPLADGQRLRIWSIPQADKAFAWNFYLHDLRSDADIAFCTDAAVQVKADALALMSAAMASSPDALAASGVPTMGPSAQRLRENMLRHGGVHGNLYALRGEAMAGLRAIGFRLPLGIYRTDPTLMSVVRFGLDPARQDWNERRLLVHPEATWTYAPLRWWRSRDLRAYQKRMLRQAQGTLENCAARQYLAIERRAPGKLPHTVAEFVGEWIASHPDEARKLFIRQPLCWLAARRLRESLDRFVEPEQPRLVADRRA
jgi:hypothetical protein